MTRIATNIAVHLVFCFAFLASAVYKPVQAGALNHSFAITVGDTNNIGRTPVAADRISDHFVEAHYGIQTFKRLNIANVVTYGIGLKAAEYDDYPYDHISYNANVGLERKLGLGFNKATLFARLEGSVKNHSASVLDTNTLTLNLGVSKPINQRLDTSINISRSWQSAKTTRPLRDLPADFGLVANNALDQNQTSVALGIEYFANEDWSFPIRLNYIDGELDSVSRLTDRRLSYLNAMNNFPEVGRNWFIYRFDGKALVYSITASKLLNDGSMINIGATHTKTRADSFFDYDQNILSLSWVKNWQ